MTPRVLGPARNRRNRWLTLGPTLLIVLLALMFTAGAQAVHLDDLFELDANAVHSDTPSPNDDDWDQVFAASPNCSSFGAVACTFVHDPAGATIFTGGGSKDDLNIDQWRHSTGSVPDKDEIEDAFAALYNRPSDGHQILYFGADRVAVNGSADAGFWFLQSDISLNADGTFNGLHTVGDVLFLTTFTNGGADTTIRAFKWVGSGGDTNGTLDDLGVTLGDCTDAPATDQGCGTVNDADITSPWTYQTKKQGVGPNIIPAGGFYEGGVDLTALGIGGCFSTFFAETRSSPSVDATLKDFVRGRFAVCRANINTTPSSASIVLGQSVTDTAVVTGEGFANAPTPTGTVKFFICSPAQLDANGLCSSGGTQVGTPPEGETLSQVSPGSASATSESFTPNATGRWCWRGEYVPAAGSPYDPRSDSDSSECLTVITLQTTINTTPSSTSIDLGQSVTDHAQVDGSVDGGPPAGTVKFFICSPAELTNGVCSSGGTQVGTPAEGETLVPIPNTTSSQVDSESFQPTSVGTWCWRGEYVPAAGSPYEPSIDADASECLTVNKLPPGINTTPSSAEITLGQSVTDHAVVTGTPAGGPPTGTVKFFICSPTQLDLSGLCSSGGTQVGTPAEGETLSPIGITNSSEATSESFTPDAIGKWCWRGEYSGDDDYKPSSDSDESECLNVIQLQPALDTTQTWTVKDSATVTVSGGGDLAGSVTFELHRSATCTDATPILTETKPVSGASPQTVETTPQTITVSEPTLYWKVSYTSTNGAHKDIPATCTENSSLTIDNTG
jgi:hypothetical protein